MVSSVIGGKVTHDLEILKTIEMNLCVECWWFEQQVCSELEAVRSCYIPRLGIRKEGELQGKTTMEQKVAEKTE